MVVKSSYRDLAVRIAAYEVASEAERRANAKANKSVDDDPD